MVRGSARKATIAAAAAEARTRRPRAKVVTKKIAAIVPAEVRAFWPTSIETRLEFYNAAVAAHQSHREALKSNPDAPIPAVLDSFNIWKEQGSPMPRTTETTTPNGRPARRTVADVVAPYNPNQAAPAAPKERTMKHTPSTRRYLHDGKPVSDAGNRLSAVAWFYTKGISKATPDRLPVAELKKVLAKLGVADPTSPTWEVTLPNGVVLACVDELAVENPGAPNHPTAKKAAARVAAIRKDEGATFDSLAEVLPKTRKAPAKKAAASTAKKAPAKQVTPRPKAAKKATTGRRTRATAKA